MLKKYRKKDFVKKSATRKFGFVCLCFDPMKQLHNLTTNKFGFVCISMVNKKDVINYGQKKQA